MASSLALTSESETAVSQMRPPASLASYLQNMGNELREEHRNQGGSISPSMNSQTTGGQTGGQSTGGPPAALVATAQREVQKFKAFQERRALLTQGLQNLDMQLTKTQGALEVFQAMGILRQG
jgi:hypothetical protein